MTNNNRTQKIYKNKYNSSIKLKKYIKKFFNKKVTQKIRKNIKNNTTTKIHNLIGGENFIFNLNNLNNLKINFEYNDNITNYNQVNFYLNDIKEEIDNNNNLNDIIEKKNLDSYIEDYKICYKYLNDIINNIQNNNNIQNIYEKIKEDNDLIIHNYLYKKNIIYICTKIIISIINLFIIIFKKLLLKYNFNNCKKVDIQQIINNIKLYKYIRDSDKHKEITDHNIKIKLKEQLENNFKINKYLFNTDNLNINIKINNINDILLKIILFLKFINKFEYYINKNNISSECINKCADFYNIFEITSDNTTDVKEELNKKFNKELIKIFNDNFVKKLKDKVFTLNKLPEIDNNEINFTNDLELDCNNPESLNIYLDKIKYSFNIENNEKIKIAGSFDFPKLKKKFDDIIYLYILSKLSELSKLTELIK